MQHNSEADRSEGQSTCNSPELNYSIHCFQPNSKGLFSFQSSLVLYHINLKSEEDHAPIKVELGVTTDCAILRLNFNKCSNAWFAPKCFLGKTTYPGICWSILVRSSSVWRAFVAFQGLIPSGGIPRYIWIWMSWLICVLLYKSSYSRILCCF